MPLPYFNDDGELPPGVHAARLAEIVYQFGGGSKQRRRVAARLERIYRLARSTGHLHRIVVFGSFVTFKEDPDDVDVVLVMDDEFELSSVDAEAAMIFDHMTADAHFGASVFWTRRSSAIGGEQGMIEYWQTRREGGLRGIVEVIGE